MMLAIRMGAQEGRWDDEPPATSARAVSASDDFLRQLAKVLPRDPPRGTPTPGDRVGRFRIGEILGSGGMGIVYAASDEALGRTVALKVLPPAFEVDDERRRRFLREARAASAVVHPNLAAIHEVGETGGYVFIAMELVHGRTLARLLRDGRMTVSESLRIGRGIAEGLAGAHAVGVVHRDLKPDNVMVDEAGTVKILDFGIAKLPTPHGALGPSTLTHEGSILGTPGYMSPEQAFGSAVDARSDVFSIGALLYEMVTGRPPFVGESAMHVLVATTRDAPVAPSRLEPAVGGALEALIVRCLAKEPEDRFPDASALLRAMEELRDGARPAPFARRFALGCVAGAIVVGGLGVASLRSHGAARASEVPSAPSVSSAPSVWSVPSAAAVAAPPAARPTEGEPPLIPVDRLPAAAPSTAPRRPTPAPARAAGAPPRASASASAPAGAGCAPPYYLDPLGDKKWKPECL
jgi:hypothetical protein